LPYARTAEIKGERSENNPAAPTGDFTSKPTGGMDGGGRPMRAELRASLEELMEEYSREVGRLQEMRREVAKVSATASRADGMVSVAVGPRGQVTAITFDPRVYRKLTPSELSKAIMELIAEATADAAEQMKKIMTPFMPEGLGYEEVLGEKGDFTAFLPQPSALSGESRDARD
jgi:DNA-binding protein YbaB